MSQQEYTTIPEQRTPVLSEMQDHLLKLNQYWWLYCLTRKKLSLAMTTFFDRLDQSLEEPEDQELFAQVQDIYQRMSELPMFAALVRRIYLNEKEWFADHQIDLDGQLYRYYDTQRFRYILP